MNNFYKKPIIKKYMLTTILGGLLFTGNITYASEAHNSFDDIPQDHWSRQAITELVDKGIITGYTNGTFKGNEKITRFEMAKMVANAMSKEESLSIEEKKNLDKLVQEFTEELNSLNVHVNNLEKRADNIKFSGQLAQKWNRGLVYGTSRDGKTDDTWSEKYFELKANAPIADSGFTLNSQLEIKFGGADFNDEEFDEENSKITQAWIEGNLGKTGQYIKAGVFCPWVQWGFVSGGSKIGGVSLEHYNNKYNTHLFGGKVRETIWDLGVGAAVDYDNTTKIYDDFGNLKQEVANIITNDWSDFVRNHSTKKVIKNAETDWKFEDPTGKNDFGGVYKTDIDGNQISHKSPSLYGFVYDYNFTDDFNSSLGYYRFSSDAYDGEPLNIFAGMMNYKLDKNFNLQTQYAHGDQGGYDNAWNIELQYKGNPWIDVKKPHNFGSYIAYRYMAPDAIVKSNYDGVKGGQKGIEVGMFYTFTENIQGVIKFFKGKSLITDDKRARLFMALENYF